MSKNIRNVLVVGGVSGLGLAISKIFKQSGFKVFATGRNTFKSEQNSITNIDLHITQDAEKLIADLDSIIKDIPHIDILVYAAGYTQKGVIDKLNDTDIRIMINVGLLAPALMIQKILLKQECLYGFIAITSTSQWIPRLEEPVYAAVKAGMAMLSNSVSLDPRISKTLVVGPSGMNTKMQAENKWSGELLDVDWVAKQIVTLYDDEFKYKLARILRDPPRVEVIESRK